MIQIIIIIFHKLSSLVESKNIDLLAHPVILLLINLKWKKFGRINAWFDFFLTLVYIACWITFSIWVPWNLKNKYDLTTHSDRFRLTLFILGIIFTLFYSFKELKQVYNEYLHKKVFF